MDALRRDWAKLPRDLAAEIAGCLLGIDVSEYIRFRAVCKPWRRSTDDPRGVLSSRFFPRNWAMLTNYGEGGDDDTRRRRLLNVATGASIADDFPEFSGHHPLGCADGLLVLENTATSGGIRLFENTAVPATSCSFYLAPSGSGNAAAAGMLMIMAHTSGENEFVEQVEQVEVFEVDVDGRRLIPRSTVVGAAGDHDRALFVGLVRALSVSTKLFPSIAGSANAVYFCHGQGFRGELFRVFHVDDGRAEPAVELEFFEQMQGRQGPFFGPFNLDIYLACCVDVFFFC